MATSATFIGDGSTTTFDIDFQFDDPATIHVMVDEVETAFEWSSASQVRLAAAPASGSTVRLYRLTSIDNPDVVFQDPQVLIASNLNEAIDQVLDSQQELWGELEDLSNASLRATLGESVARLPSEAERAGKFFVWGPDGSPQVSSGTGADAGLRDDLAAPDGWSRVGGVREKLTADRTYYINAATGSDLNDGLTPASAFATIQKAYSTAVATLDLNGFSVITSVADGTYPDPITVFGSLIGAGGANGRPFQIIGNEAVPGNVNISTVGNTAIKMGARAYLFLAGVHIETTIGGYGLLVNDHSTLQFRNCSFGDVFVDMIRPQKHCTVEQVSNDDGTPSTLDVIGNANAFVHFTDRSLVKFTNQTIIFHGNTFATYLWGGNNASLLLDGVTFDTSLGKPSGGITAHDHAFINTQSCVGDWNGGELPIVQDGSVIASDGYNARTFYVRPDGNDGNSGTKDTAEGAFKTLTGCIEALAKFPRDPAWWSTSSGARIICRAGTYAEGINLRDLPFSSASIEGDEAAPATVAVASPGDAFVATGLTTVWTLKGFKLSAAAGNCIRAENGSRVFFQNIEFGTASANHIQVKSGGYVRATGNYAISGGAARHVLAEQGLVDLSSRTVTLTGTPAFSQRFLYAVRNSSIIAAAMTFVGTATGVRYDVQTCACIDTSGGGATYLPGSAAGVTATGGQYA